MHFNFHLTGDESPEKMRRIANAVLALGGLPDTCDGAILAATEYFGTHNIITPEAFGVQPDGIVTEKGKEPRSATIDEMLEAGHHVTQGSGRYVEPGDELRYSAVNAETGVEIPSESMSANEIKQLVSSPTITITEKTCESMNNTARDPIVEMESGWYYYDETWSEAIGPFVDEKTAREDLTKYQEYLNQPHECEAPPASTPPIPQVPPVEQASFDSKGLPWDDRIHSSSRKFNADGSWRCRKNVPEETKLAVEGELRALVGGMLAEGITPFVPAVPLVAPPAPPVPPSVPTVPSTPPVPSALTRTYSDVVNIIMSRKIGTETFVAILGSDLPTFVHTCKADPTAATVAFNALDHASRS